MFRFPNSDQVLPWLPLLFAPVVATGCWLQGSESNTSDSETTSTEISSPASAGKAVSGKSQKLVDGWKQPRVALVLTGQANGYLEPCGCSETQSGGISRRSDLFKQLSDEKGWNVVGLSLGDLIKRSRRQDQIKFGVMLEALKDMGYAAMTLGPHDLKLQVDYLFSTMPASTNPETELPFVSSNVVFYDTPDIGTPARHKVIEINGVKIGVTGVLGKEFAEEIFPEGDNSANSLLSVQDPVESLLAPLEALKKENCDVLVLLAQANEKETASILQQVEGFDVCLTAGGPEDPSGRTKKVGETMVLEGGRKGKYAGVLGYYPDEDERFRYELVDLDQERFSRTEQMEDHMRFYQELLREQNIIESEPAVPHPSGATFVGAEKCGECHTKAYAKWKETRHSHATETLIHGHEDYQETEWINRVHDPECLSCHSTGWHPQQVFRYEGGFTGMDKTPKLAGQGCENCHGPGSRHTELEMKFKEIRESTPEIVQARENMKIDMVTVEKEVCVRCHDYENSPNFDFDKYWPKVQHRGKN